jgi:hypothetical protein
MAIVTHAYRPRRARKRTAQAADMPTIVRAGKKAPVAATNGDDRKSAIVTAKHRRRHGSVSDVPDMAPEEHKRRGDAADALFREMRRQIATKARL